MPVAAGTFVPFLLDYNTLSSAQQAQRMLDQAADAVAGGQRGAAIVYSANHGQTVAIRAAYARQQWITSISGSNQAKVIMALEHLLQGDASAQQGTMRIAPISTMSYPAGSDPLTIVQDDLTHIEAMIDDGWRVLGWQNLGTVHSDRPYAVGGGVAGGLPQHISDAIQGTLTRLATEHPPAAS